MTTVVGANSEFEAARARILSAYTLWSEGRSLSAGRLVQYLGPEVVGAKDLELSQVLQEIKCLVDEGLHVAWAEQSGVVYLSVWEYPAPQPEWAAVFSEVDS